MRLFSVLCVLFATTLLAAPPLIITDKGYFISTIEDGVPKYVQLTDVTDLRGNPTPAPKPEPDPKPTPPVTSFTEKVTSWAKDISEPSASQALAYVYADVAAANLDSPWAVLKEASTQALKIVEADDDKWQEFRLNVGAVINDRSRTGTLDPIKTLKEVQLGLEKSAAGSPALPAETVKQIRLATQALIGTQ